MRRSLVHLTVCLAAAAAPLLAGRRIKQDRPVPVYDFPADISGIALRALPLSDREAAFAAESPGATGRFTDGTREYIFRRVTEPTRRLHASSDCLRAVGYELSQQSPRRDDESRLWSRYRAVRSGEVLIVEEQIRDADGKTFSDVSAWYWSALLGRSRGPWLAITVAQKETGT